MKSLLRRRWLLWGIAVLLVSISLAFWAVPEKEREHARPRTVRALIRALQREDTALNRLELKVWNRLPGFVQERCKFVQPSLAREVRFNACLELQSLEAKAAEAVPYLTRALDDPDAAVGGAALAALKSIGRPAASAKGRLLAVLRGGSPRLKPDDVACALAAVAPQDPEVVSALLQFMAQPGLCRSPGVIAHALIRQTPEALSLFETMRKILPKKATWSLVPALAWSYEDREKRLAMWAGLLEDPDYGIRYQAAGALGELGPAAKDSVPKLLELFHATEREWEDSQQEPQHARFRAYKAFIKAWGSPAARYDVSGSNDPWQAEWDRRVAAEPRHAHRYRLSVIPQDSFTAPVPGLGGMHVQIIQALGRIGSGAHDALPLLAMEYQDHDNPLWFEAAKARLKIDGDFPTIAPILAAAVREVDVEARPKLISDIVHMAYTFDGAGTILVGALADPDANVRLEVLKGLAALRDESAPALPALIAALEAPESEIRLQVTRNLSVIGLANAAPAVVPTLAKAVADLDPKVRLGALESLAEIGLANAALIIPTLAKAVADPDPKVQLGALESLAKLGSQAAPALPALIAALERPELEVRLQAMRNLAILGGSNAAPAVPALAKAVADPDVKVRSGALECLAALGAQAEPALPAVIAALNGDPEKDLRVQAVRSLKVLASHSVPVAPALIQALADPDKNVRAAAADALGELGDQGRAALPALRKMNGDPTYVVRIVASNAIHSIESTINSTNRAKGSPAERLPITH